MTDENKDYQKDRFGKPLALERRDASLDGRRFSPSTGRNKDAVRDVFLAHMPQTGAILEIASGTGEHGAHIAEAALGLFWIYSDIDEPSRASQRAWRDAAGHDRIHGPLTIDTTHATWPDMPVDASLAGVFCANMIHIAPFEAAKGLLQGAGRILSPGGRLMLYGPFARDGEIAPSNARFSEDLKRRNEDWGVRDLDRDIVPLATQSSLHLIDAIEMPANNMSVIFEKR